MSLAFGGIAIALSGKMVFHLDVIVLMGVLMSLAGMFYIAAYPYLPRGLRFDASSASVPDTDILLQAGSTNKLPPMDLAHAVPSVTEHTTNLLKVPARRDGGQ